MGRISRYRSVPACASPATESPAITATATGRNSGSTIARAATEYSEPLDSTADRNAGPCPGRGPTCVTASSTATTIGRRFSSTRVSQVRGRRNSLTSSVPIMIAARDRCPEWSGPGRCPRDCAARARSVRPGCRPRRVARSAGTRRARARSGCPRRGVRTREFSSPTAASPSGVRTTVRPVGRCRCASSSCTISRPRSSTPTRVHSCSTSASRWLDRNTVVPCRLRSSSRSRTSRIPCGSRPLVGSSSTSSSGERSSAAARPSRCRMPSE